MCGIAGIYNLTKGGKVEHSLVQTMIEKLHHRGPDGVGFLHEQNICLGHARLSIIDIAGGKQPIHNEDKTVWVVFNGEIFNYIELRKDLEKKGHIFYTKTDTEVLVHLYEEYKEGFVQYLNGQFAIVLWDKLNNQLLMVRDRVGITPLFYHKHENKLFFASEVKAILSAIKIPPVLNHHALDQLMTFWSPVSPNTIFKDIYEVSPGQMVIVKNGKLTKRTYWDWFFPGGADYLNKSEADLTEQLHQLLVDATQIRLRSDVPVGAYLSGGLDSSVLVSLIHNYSDSPLRTFSIGFADQGLDETEYQQQMINHLKTKHSRIHCTNNDIATSFMETIWHTESPVLRTAPVPMGILSGLVRDNNYKVVLTGEGSDEVFGGYDIFKETKIRQFWSKNPGSTFRPILLKRLYPYLDLSKSQGISYLKSFFGKALEAPTIPYFSHLPRWETTAKCKEFFSPELKNMLVQDAVDIISSTFPEELNQWHYFNKAQYIEAKSLMAGYLLCSQGDRMLMQHSVEGRFPFLDHNVIEFANKLHPRFKMKVLNEKYLLKKTMKKYLPETIIKRYKQPYRAPDIPAFFGEIIPDYVEELLSDKKIKDYGYFDSGRVERLVKKIKLGRAIGYKDNMSLVGILSTQIWHYLFIEKFNSIDKGMRIQHA